MGRGDDGRVLELALGPCFSWCWGLNPRTHAWGAGTLSPSPAYFESLALFV